MATSGVEVRFTVILSAWFTAAAHTSRIRAITGGTARKQITAGHWWLREHHPDPCSCAYVVARPGPVGCVVLPDRGQRTFDGMQATHILELRAPVGSFFVITPGCPHHGHLANAHLHARLYAMARADAIAQGLSEQFGIDIRYDTRPLLSD